MSATKEKKRNKVRQVMVRVYPASRPETAGIDSTPPTLKRIRGREWMEVMQIINPEVLKDLRLSQRLALVC